MIISSLTLYHYPLSRSARAKFLLHELRGGDFETVKVDMLKGEGFSSEFIAKNPNHAVPVLDIQYADGSKQTMIESGAMIVWLADAHPEKGLAPAPDDLAARADYLQMVFFGAAHMDMSLWQIRLNETLLSESVRSQSIADFNREKIKNEMMPQLETRLERNPYICGENFTAADCLMAQNINWGRAYGLCSSPVFKRYMLRLYKRDAFQKAYADAKEFER